MKPTHKKMLSEEIKQFFKGEITTDAKQLESFSQDASIFKITPEIIVSPRDVIDLKNLVMFASNEKKKRRSLSLTARSGGTDMTGGPLTKSIVVDFTKHFNVIEDSNEKTITTQPGVYYRDIEKINDERGVMIPSYPASKSICTIGGMVNNNSGGEKTLAYGKTENYVDSMKAVFSDGNEYEVKPLNRSQLEEKMSLQTFEGHIYREIVGLIEKNDEEIKKAKPNVSKNSAGYYLWNVWNEDKTIFNLCRLLVGSQGTLALTTEITLRLIPKKKYSRLIVLFLKDLEPLVPLIQKTLEFSPESFESYDDNTLRLAIRFFSDIARRLKLGNMLSLGVQFLPEVFMVLKGGLPKLVLLAQLTSDDEDELKNRLEQFRVALKKFDVSVRITKDEKEAEKYWTIRRESFNLLRQRIKNKHTAPFIDDFSVRPETLHEFLPRLNKILEPHADKLTYTIAGHAGDGNFHIIPLMDLTDSDSRALIPKLSEEVYRLVLEFHGSITAEHNDGLIRTPYLEMMYGKKICDLFLKTKEIFDPQGIFNPGKKVRGDWEYALKHMRTDNR